MFDNFTFILVIASFGFIAGQERIAIAVLRGPSGVQGNVTFKQAQYSSEVTVSGNIIGLTAGSHGFHVHEKGDLSNGCASTGSHYNPNKHPHGSPEDSERHVGDLGNILGDKDGEAHFSFVDRFISLTGRQSIIGRAVVVHADADDLGRGGQSDSRTTGHAGGRVACGVVGLVQEWSTNGTASNGNYYWASLLLICAHLISFIR